MGNALCESGRDQHARGPDTAARESKISHASAKRTGNASMPAAQRPTLLAAVTALREAGGGAQAQT